MKLLVGGLITDRGDITDCFIKHIIRLSQSLPDITWFWIICIPNDGSVKKWESEIRYLSLLDHIIYRDEAPPYSRDSINKNGDGYRLSVFRRMAFLRNLLRERALYKDVDALVSIDSDICPPIDLLQRLVAANKPWVSALVDNSAPMNREHDPELFRMKGEAPEHGCLPLFNVMNLEEAEPGLFITNHFAPDLINGGECDTTGAVCFYSRKLLEAARWQEHMAGEDIGFALNARRAGFKAHYMPLKCDHLMTEQRLAVHLQNCDICR
jgi:hypothetical protein